VTKAKVAPRRPVVAEADETDLPEAWRKRPWIPILIVGVLIAAVLGSGLLVDKALEPQVPAALAGCKTSTQIGPREFIGPQPMCITATHTYVATITTTQGPIVIQLHPGFYNGLNVWKSEDWVVQAGDPRGDGRGGPGYSLPDEPSTDTWRLGALGMARVPGGAVNGSQFFIQKASWPAPGPTATYNRFATVISGLDKVQLLQVNDTIKSITIKVS